MSNPDRLTSARASPLKRGVSVFLFARVLAVRSHRWTEIVLAVLAGGATFDCAVELAASKAAGLNCLGSLCTRQSSAPPSVSDGQSREFQSTKKTRNR